MKLVKGVGYYFKSKTLTDIVEKLPVKYFIHANVKCLINM